MPSSSGNLFVGFAETQRSQSDKRHLAFMGHPKHTTSKWNVGNSKPPGELSGTKKPRTKTAWNTTNGTKFTLSISILSLSPTNICFYYIDLFPNIVRFQCWRPSCDFMCFWKLSLKVEGRNDIDDRPRVCLRLFHSKKGIQSHHHIPATLYLLS